MSSSVHTEDSQWKNPSIYSRKDKSLGLLCSNFLKLCDREGVDTVGLDNAADKLGVERRRIYDIVNILESVGVLSRKAKNQYRWNGYSAIPKAVDLLKKEGLKDLSTASSTCHNVSNVIACNHSDVKETGEGNTSGLHKIDNRKEKSLMILAQNFVKLFHCSNVDLISLDKAASALLGDIHDPMAVKTKTRRLYDIANVFVSLNLIEKIRSPDNGKPVFRWIAWKENRTSGSPAAATSDESMRRTFGTEITNTIPKRCRDDSSSDLMSNGQVKRLKVAKDDELKDKNQISAEQHDERGTKDFVFGPFGPSSLPKSGVSGKENLKHIQNLEDLASKYYPQYQNKAASELFAHYVDAWKSWQVEAANELHKQHEH
ncbi:E2F transcription factor-like E2FF isoform X1 [Capsicum galapagoense]